MKSSLHWSWKRLLYLSLFLLLTPPLQAQKVQPRPPTLPSAPRIQTTAAPRMPEVIEIKLEALFTGISNGIVEGSFRELFAGTPFEKDFELSNRLIDTTKNSLKHFGNMRTYTIFEVKKYSSHLIRVTYLTHHHHKHIRWQFLFTSNDSDWQLVNFDIDDMRNFLPKDPIKIPPPGPTQLRVEKFFLKLQNDKIRMAFNDFLNGTGLLQQPRMIENFINQVEVATKEYGKMSRYELFDNRSLKLDTKLLTYVTYLENKPLRWQLFYQAIDHENWELTNLRVDDLLVVSLLE
ncbi:MAG: hypothetical protein AAGA18_11025 [Verrucomicrobiota bacterium]